jgi:hypothetical protein
MTVVNPHLHFRMVMLILYSILECSEPLDVL